MDETIIYGVIMTKFDDGTRSLFLRSITEDSSAFTRGMLVAFVSGAIGATAVTTVVNKLIKSTEIQRVALRGSCEVIEAGNSERPRPVALQNGYKLAR